MHKRRLTDRTTTSAEKLAFTVTRVGDRRPKPSAAKSSDSSGQSAQSKDG